MVIGPGFLPQVQCVRVALDALLADAAPPARHLGEMDQEVVLDERFGTEALPLGVLQNPSPPARPTVRRCASTDPGPPSATPTGGSTPAANPASR